MKRSVLPLVSVTLLAALGMSLHSQAQTQNQPPSPSRSRSEEMLDRWNDIGNKLIAMAQDFPEDKYDFKVQRNETSEVVSPQRCISARFLSGEPTYRLRKWYV